MRNCSIEGCENRHNARGWCMTHYRRWRLYNDPLGQHPSRLSSRTCSITRCEKPKANRGWCQTHHWRWRHYGDPLREPYPDKGCSEQGCKGKHKAHGLCAKHYRRKKRGIPLDYAKPKLAKKRYRILTQPGHPMAFKNGRVAEHRKVLFDSLGYDRVPCFWCGKGLVFGDNLFVDHLNHDRHDNRVENLVPSCNGCNAGRTRTNPRIRQPLYEAA